MFAFLARRAGASALTQLAGAGAPAYEYIGGGGARISAFQEVSGVGVGAANSSSMATHTYFNAHATPHPPPEQIQIASASASASACANNCAPVSYGAPRAVAPPPPYYPSGAGGVGAAGYCPSANVMPINGSCAVAVTPSYPHQNNVTTQAATAGPSSQQQQQQQHMYASNPVSNYQQLQSGNARFPAQTAPNAYQQTSLPYEAYPQTAASGSDANAGAFTLAPDFMGPGPGDVSYYTPSGLPQPPPAATAPAATMEPAGSSVPLHSSPLVSRRAALPPIATMQQPMQAPGAGVGVPEYASFGAGAAQQQSHPQYGGGASYAQNQMNVNSVPYNDPASNVNVNVPYYNAQFPGPAAAPMSQLPQAQQWPPPMGYGGQQQQLPPLQPATASADVLAQSIRFCEELRKETPARQQELMQNLVLSERTSSFRMHPFFGLLRDLIICDMNFNSPRFPCRALMQNLPQDFEHLIRNFMMRNRALDCATMRRYIDPAIDSVVMDALRTAHSSLIAKIETRQAQQQQQSQSVFGGAALPLPLPLPLPVSVALPAGPAFPGTNVSAMPMPGVGVVNAGGPMAMSCSMSSVNPMLNPLSDCTLAPNPYCDTTSFYTFDAKAGMRPPTCAPDTRPLPLPAASKKHSLPKEVRESHVRVVEYIPVIPFRVLLSKLTIYS